MTYAKNYSIVAPETRCVGDSPPALVAAAQTTVFRPCDWAWISDTGGNLAQRVNETFSHLSRRVVVSSGAGVLTTSGHVQVQMRRVDVLRAFADRPDLLPAQDAISLLNQLLIEVRVTQAGPVISAQ